ncbi:unnamed protein product [Laminaria digitata]
MTVTDTTAATATTGESFPAGDLWKDQPVIVFVVRRPGCALCREHAVDLSEKQSDFAAKGVKLVGVVHEKLGVEEFSDFFKNGEIYFDEEKAFFNALGMRWEGLSSMLKPSVINNVKRVRNREVKGNLTGEGRLLGGLLVVGAGNSGVSFEHREAVSDGIDLIAGTVPARLDAFVVTFCQPGDAAACNHNCAWPCLAWTSYSPYEYFGIYI